MSKKQMETTLINQYIHFSKRFLAANAWQSLLWWPQGKTSKGAVPPRETKPEHPSSPKCLLQTVRKRFPWEAQHLEDLKQFFPLFFFSFHIPRTSAASLSLLWAQHCTPQGKAAPQKCIP